MLAHKALALYLIAPCTSDFDRKTATPIYVLEQRKKVQHRASAMDGCNCGRQGDKKSAVRFARDNKMQQVEVSAHAPHAQLVNRSASSGGDTQSQGVKGSIGLDTLQGWDKSVHIS